MYVVVVFVGFFKVGDFDKVIGFVYLFVGVVFGVNVVVIILFVSLFSYVMESVVSWMGDIVGVLMNVIFGNVVELIIFMFVLVVLFCFCVLIFL